MSHPGEGVSWYDPATALDSVTRIGQQAPEVAEK